MASHESLNSLGPGDPYMHHGAGSSLFQVMSCCLSAPSHYLHQCWLVVNGTLRNKVQWSFNPKLNIIIDEIVFWRCRRPKWRPSCLSLNVLNIWSCTTAELTYQFWYSNTGNSKADFACTQDMDFETNSMFTKLNISSCTTAEQTYQFWYSKHW